MKDANRQNKALPLPAHLSQLMDLNGNCLYLADSSLPETEAFDALLLRWAEDCMDADDLERFKTEFALTKLVAAGRDGAKNVQFLFQTHDKEQRQLVIRFMIGDSGDDVLGILNLYAIPESKDSFVESSVSLDVLAMPYAAFASVVLNQDSICSRKITKDDLSYFSGMQGDDCDTLFSSLCESNVLTAWQEEYKQRFSYAELKKFNGENRLISYTFLSGLGQLHQDVFVVQSGEKILLCIGVLLREKSALMDISTQGNVSDFDGAVADMQMAMMFERKEMKAHVRRSVIILTLLGLMVGCILGAVLDRQGGLYSRILNQYYPQATEMPTEEEIVASEPAATPQPVVPVYVSRSESANFSAEVSSNGTGRTSTSITDYDTYTFTAKVTNVMDPEDFKSKYTKIVMDGTEACVVFNLKFAAISGESKKVIPQEAFQLSLIGSNGETVEEYQLMDKAAGGNYNVSLSDGEEKLFYKRYQYSEEIDYLVLSYYQDGQRKDFYFALNYDDPNVKHSTLKFDDSKRMVRYLKEKLKELGYYSGNINEYFDNATVKAVKAAQEDFGLEQTGVADSDFQQLLYSK